MAGKNGGKKLKWKQIEVRVNNDRWQGGQIGRFLPTCWATVYYVFFVKNTEVAQILGLLFPW
jgi:hypothetical protein